MKVTVDTTAKTVQFLENITIKQFKEEFDNTEWDDYAIIPFVQYIYTNNQWGWYNPHYIGTPCFSVPATLTVTSS